MNETDKAGKIAGRMLENDAFSRRLGIEIVKASPGRAVLRMVVRNDMTNGFGVAHGGIAFSLADSALAFAASSHGRIAFAMDNKISFLKTVYAGDTLTAVAEEEYLGRQIGVYNITINNKENTVIALMRGTVFRTNKDLLQGERP